MTAPESEVKFVESRERRAKVGRRGNAAGRSEGKSSIQSAVSKIESAFFGGAMRQKFRQETSLTADEPEDYQLEQQLPQVVIMELWFFEQVKQAVQIWWQGQPLILNLTQMDVELAQRAVDFVAGATCSLEGRQQSLAPRLFLFAPKGIHLANPLDETALL